MSFHNMKPLYAKSFQLMPGIPRLPQPAVNIVCLAVQLCPRICRFIIFAHSMRKTCTDIMRHGEQPPGGCIIAGQTVKAAAMTKEY